MSDPRRPGEEAEIARFLAERGATILPPAGREDPVFEAFLAARLTKTRKVRGGGKKRSRDAMNRYWKMVRSKRADG